MDANYNYSTTKNQVYTIIELINEGLHQDEIIDQLSQRFNKERTWAIGRLNKYFRYYGDYGVLDARIKLESINAMNLSQKYLNVYLNLSRIEDKQ